MNLVAEGLLGGIIYTSNSQVVWNDLYERFKKIDGSRVFTLHKEIVTNSGSVVSTNFLKSKNLLKEFETLMPTPDCNYDKPKEFVTYLQKLKLLQFLWGLWFI